MWEIRIGAGARRGGAGQIGPYTITDLGLIPGAWSCVPEAMNNSGEAVGWANMSGVGGGVRAFLWTPAEGMVQIGPSDMTNTWAVDVTDSGLVLGIGCLGAHFA